MTENLAPVEGEQTDTSSVEPVLSENESAVTSPQQFEPDIAQDTADETDSNDDETPMSEQKLYAGKYKSPEELEKGYLEAQKFVGKAGELEKQLAAYKQQEAQLSELMESQAREQGFSDTAQLQIAADIAAHELNLFAKALEAGYAGDNYEAALDALSQYGQTGNPNDLALAKRLFAPEALEFIAENRKAFKDAKIQEYQTTKQHATFQATKQTLQSFVNETGDWINPPERQETLGVLLREFGGNLDLNTAKSMIDKIEQGAVERYKNTLDAYQEQQDRFDQMQTPHGINASVRTDRWFTKADVDKMSEAEYVKNADKIVRQMQMENEGLLPQTLTK